MKTRHQHNIENQTNKFMYNTAFGTYTERCVVFWQKKAILRNI